MALLDTIIAVGVVLILLLIVASRVTKQTIPEMLGGITDWLSGRKEDAEDKYMEITE